MREIDPRAFGSRVAERRAALGMSQEDLAAVSGLSQSNIGYIENGSLKRNSALLGHANALAGPLLSSADYLLWKTGPAHVGPRYIPERHFTERYQNLPSELKEMVSEALEKAEKMNAKRRGAR